ncbi:MAG: ABC transporter ATP-binding protein [Deltaproteobacteria bacterium]|nr:ABC transporter ATP-binding protein [Deltaproteobacteria bacterium]
MLFLSLIHLLIGLILARSTFLFKTNLFLPVFLAFSLGLLLTFFEDYISHPVAENINKELTDKAFLQFLHQPCNESSLEKLNFSLSNSQWAAEAAFSLLRSLFRRILQLAGFSLYLLYLDWRLFLILLVSSPLVFLPGWIMGKKSSNYRQNVFKYQSKLAGFYSQSAQNHATVKAYESEDFFHQLQISKLENLALEKVKHRRFESLNKPLSLLGMVISFSLVFFTSAYLTKTGEISVQTRFTFFTIMALLYAPLSGLSHDLLVIKSMLGQNIQLPDLENTASDIAHSNQPKVKPKAQIKLDNISFSYNKNKIFDNYSQTFNKGNIYAVTGKNGSGKTTLIHLIQGIITPEQGEIIVDSKPCQQGISSGYLDQEGSVYHDTIKANLIFGRKDKKIISSAINHFHNQFKLPPLSRFIENKNISGGEKRKISLLRALISATSLLILDEPEDSLDLSSKNQLLKILGQQQKNKLIIIITHSQKFMDCADEIIELS